MDKLPINWQNFAQVRLHSSLFLEYGCLIVRIQQGRANVINDVAINYS